jgi:hypothetical protein
MARVATTRITYLKRSKLFIDKLSDTKLLNERVMVKLYAKPKITNNLSKWPKPALYAKYSYI